MAAAALALRFAGWIRSLSVFQFECVGYGDTRDLPHVSLYEHFDRLAFSFRRTGWYFAVSGCLPVGSRRAVLSFYPFLCGYEPALACVCRVRDGAGCVVR